MRVIYAVLLAAVVVARADAFLEDTDLAMVESSANHHEVTLPTKRLLRTKETGDDGYEERAGGIPISAVEKAKALITPAASTEKLKTWLNSGKSLDDVFVRLKLDKAKDKLLSSPQFTNWLNYADDLTSKTGKEASAIATLTTQYGDEALTKILEAAKKIEGTKAVATRLEAEQMQSWLAAGSTADDVFKLLRLDKAGDDVLTSSLFNTWSTYMQIFNKENPAKKTTLYATLATHYNDDVLARMVEAAKKVKTTVGTAKRVEATQIQSWLGRKQTPDSVFKLLKLDSAGDDVLANPALNTWVIYLNTFNKENPDKKTTMIATLTAHYGDEGVSRMLDAAKKVETTKSIATNLETAQIHQWLSTGKYPASIFTRLNLDKAGDDLLSSPLFTTFTKFTDAYHAKNPRVPMTTGSIVNAYYDDLNVVKMILAGDKIPSSADAAKRMEGVVFKEWMAAPRAPDHAFEELKIGQVGLKKLFTDPMFNYWMSFMDVFTKAFPLKNVPRTMLATTYKDDDLWRMIQAAKKNPKTKEMGDKLETEILKQFIFAEKKPNDVAKLLQVSEKTDANWKLWEKYMKDYHQYHLREISS